MTHKVLITGATGFLGSHLIPMVNRDSYEITAIGKRDVDLTDMVEAERLFSKNEFKSVIHLAALSGGIGANRDRPFDFFHTNTLLVANIFHLAANYGVEHIVYTMGGCSYPNTAVSPIGESQMWEGFPHGDSAAYSSAKKLGIVAAQAYGKLGLRTTVLVPGNLYGEYDNFSLEQSHVVPALIRKFYEAKVEGLPAVTMWGSGVAARDFVYAGDVAQGVYSALEQNFPQGPINLSTGTSITISQLAHLVADIMEYPGELIWDTSKPDGQLNKIFDPSLANSLGFKADTKIDEGLRKTIDWFQNNYARRVIRL